MIRRLAFLVRHVAKNASKSPPKVGALWGHHGGMPLWHVVPLRIAKSTVNINYFALVTSPNCKKHSKYTLFCTS